MFDVDHPEVIEAVERALAEDIGSGDVTTELTVDAVKLAHGTFLAKQAFTLASIELLPLIYNCYSQRFGGTVAVSLHKHSGDRVEPGMVLADVSGPARSLLTCERVALNFMQRLSGVATLAAQFVAQMSGTGTKLLDTRKTTPGLRVLEKWASAAGGATNHRKGLFDAVLIKNNHISAAGGVRAALERVRSFDGTIEIEVRTRAELDEALAGGASHLLLDNLTPAEACEWIRYINKRALVELSGRITLDNVRAYAEAGADFVSSGAVTHSAIAVDISFRLQLSGDH